MDAPLTHFTPPERGPSDLRGHLRRETRVAHAALDALVGEAMLDDAAGYRAFLTGNYLGWAPYQNMWSEFVGEELDIVAPDYAAMIAEDLREIDEGALSRLPRPPQSSLPCGAGAVYVLAGSRLGMAIINRRQHWGAAHNIAQRFVGDTSGPTIFRALQDYLSCPRSQSIDLQRATQSALSVFETFHAAMAHARAESGLQ